MTAITALIRHRLAAVMLAALLLTACGDDSAEEKAAAEQARIDQEVEKRMAEERLTFDDRTGLLRTVRVAGFIVLCIVAVGGLLWLGGSGESAPAGREIVIHPPRPQSRVLPLVNRSGRVIDAEPSAGNPGDDRVHRPHRPNPLPSATP